MNQEEIDDLVAVGIQADKERIAGLEAELGVLRELLGLAGIVAQHARVVVGGRDITTGAHVSPCSIYSLASSADALRDALDEYDRAVIEASR